MPSNDRTLDAQLDDRLSRLGEHLDHERHARRNMATDEPVAIGARDAARDPARYRWLAAAAMIVAAVAAATFITLNRGTTSGPASTGTTMAAPASSTPSSTPTTVTPATTPTTISNTAPSETTVEPATTVPVPTETEPVETTPTETAPSSASPTTTTLVARAPDDFCQPPYGPVAAPCIYALEAGDTPALVAERFGLSVDELIFANPLMADDESLGSIWLVGSGIRIPIPGG